MPQKGKKSTKKEKDDMTIGELAKMIDSAFINQEARLNQRFDHFEQSFDQKLEQTKEEILEEIDSRGYITGKDLEKTLDSRGYATKHDLQDAITDAKDEIIAHVDQAFAPKIANHEQRITRLEHQV